jgi:Na+-transporting NADH:ubiquinone oxidoreductase subunit C
MCVIASAALSLAVSVLKEKQDENVELDIKKNILKALAISEKPLSTSDEKAEYYGALQADDIRKLYSTYVSELVVDVKGGKLEGKSAAEADGKNELPVYLKKENGDIQAYCIPTSGKGLWSTIKGYLALEADLNTVLGITFYSQGETAGLGAEISQGWFQERFSGKKILGADGSLKSITIAKGEVPKGSPEEAHQVDGISGATMTGNGINVFLRKDLERYQKFFDSARR